MHQVHGVADLAQVLHGCSVEEVLPSGRMADAEDEEDGADGLLIPVPVRLVPPRRDQRAEPSPARSFFMVDVWLRHEIHCHDAEEAPSEPSEPTLP